MNGTRAFGSGTGEVASRVNAPVVEAAMPVASAERAGGWRRVVLGLALLELLVLWAPTIGWLYERWTLSVWHNAHGLLIPFVVAYFVYQELRPFAGRPRSSSAWGFVLLVPALALHALDAGIHTELLAAGSIVVALPGLALLTLGMERTKAILFPLAFLALSLPIPLGMTEQVHMQLRLLTTAATSSVVPMFGIPVFVEGTTLHLSGGALQVADACSGFSTLYAAIAVAMLTAYTARGTGRRALVLLAAAPLAILANWLRVIALVLLVVWRGDAILDTFVHPLSGMLTFALALPIIFWLGGDTAPASRPSEGARA